jgi:hypothetical protein
MAVAARSKTGRFAPDYAIMLRRREEDHRTVYNEKTRIDSKLENVAKWEHSTSARIERNVVSKQINTIKRDLEDHLNARRYRISLTMSMESKVAQLVHPTKF